MKQTTLKALLKDSRKTVFLGGAGVSTGSGIPDFRSSRGLFSRSGAAISYEEMLSIDYFLAHPEEFYEFYKSSMLYPQASPCPAHIALARLEAQGLLDTVITQNIDGLHQKAGSRRVLELHGSAHRNHCMSCGRRYSMEDILALPGVPRCSCGGMIRPDIVFYGEPLDDRILAQAAQAVSGADLFIVGGTSLAVYPAAGLVRFMKPGGKLCLINRDPTPQDSAADLLLREDLGRVLGEAAGMEIE